MAARFGTPSTALLQSSSTACACAVHKFLGMCMKSLNSTCDTWVSSWNCCLRLAELPDILQFREYVCQSMGKHHGVVISTNS